MNRRTLHLILILLAPFVLFHGTATGQTHEKWKYLAKGVEYKPFYLDQLSETGDGKIHVVRVDPAQAKLKLILASEHDKKLRTAAQWCKEYNLIAAINAGMYGTDYSTNVGYLRNGSYVQNKQWNKKYKSVLAFDPKKSGLPQVIMVDLDDPSAMERLTNYNAVVQNLRLIKGGGINVWKESEKKWSESAVGMDKEGRILFLFCRAPLIMWDFIEMIKSLGLEVVSLMHMEGGHIASLSIRTRDITLDLAGGYENTIRPDSMNREQWPIPNILGVQTR